MISLLEAGDVDAAVQLSSEAGWNQTAEDWRMLMRLSPEGCFGIHSDGKLVATASLLRYQRLLGWIGMVLTHRDYRRRGCARALLEHIVHQADAWGIATLKLDATSDGQRLYEGLGFRPEQPVERWWRAGDAAPAGPRRNEEMPESWRAMDLEAFGLDRSSLLEAVAERSAVFASAGGFALRRAGLRAAYAGPCVALDAEAARRLMAACIRNAGAAGCYWDLLPADGAAVDLASELGFVRQRQLVRMTRGPSRAGREEWIWGIAGFELG